MSHTLKFRVRDINGKSFLENFSISRYGKLMTYSFHGCDEKCYCQPPNESNFIIQRFTGVTDKSGKEIYEGDIIKYPLGSDSSNVIITAEVQWGDCSWILFDIDHNICIGHLTCAIKRYEVVGNIFDRN